MTGQRGFTLAELLVALAMLGLVLAGVFMLQQQGQLSYMIGAAKVEAQQNARTALELMSTELRTAQSLTTTTGCDAGSSDITFVTWDDLGTQTGCALPGCWVAVRYRLNGANLERTYNGVLTVLIAGVGNLSFQCFTADNTATATAANVRNILITIQTRPEDASASYSSTYQQMKAETRVRLRNVL